MATERKVTIPSGVKVEVDGPTVRVTGPKGQLERTFRYPQISLALADNQLVISTPADRKRTVAMVGTIQAHVRNMVRGVTEGFEYRMKVVYSHFPIQLKLAENRLEINNFLGEKKPRYAQIVPGVTAKVGNDEIVLSGIDREKLGITSANIEFATKIKYRDPRIFQDGIYRVQRG
ncbi:MAG: 50S ribosomal protein L6 [Methanolinea sp.]|nr:50S ribosomal protein L6 [Methanolinea sp.]